jgi:hypothetical protein
VGVSPTVGVGNLPVAIAIADNRWACVCNNGSDTVSIFDAIHPFLSSVSTVVVGKEPLAIAIQKTKPASPKKFKGKVRHKFRLHEGTLCTTWKRSSSPDIAFYEIFAFGKRIATIPATSPRKFCKKLKSPYLCKKHLPKKFFHKLEKKYRIRAINADGVASSYKRLKVEL